MTAAESAVRFEILGSLEAYEGDQPLKLGPFKQRVVLGLLLCRANEVVSVGELSEALWEHTPPRSGHKNIQAYVSALRGMFSGESDASGAEGARLLHRPPGYLIEIGPHQLDVLRFHELVRAGRLAIRSGDALGAADLLQRAIGMWRCPILADLVSSRAIAAEVDQFREQYVAAYEDWAEVKLGLGQHTDILDSIEQMIRSSPFRERLRQAQMLALYRSGRQAEALAQFDAVRQLLARELGLEPSPVLVRLYKSILCGEQRTAPEVSGRVTPAAARTMAVGANSLTRDVADFTGRDDEVKALLGTLNEAPRSGVVVVSGPAGAGKTALVVHCAHRLADRFPDGRILTCLRAPDGRPRPTADLLGEMLRALGMTGALPAGSDERAALLRESVAGQEVLVILDDAATELQVRSVLAAAADAVAIVTSRRHLGGLESAVRLAVGPLSESTAVEMLSRLIGYERIYAEPEMARRIAAVCDRLPLAIRIAGAKLAGLRHLTLAQYAGRLADERRLLDELAVGDLVIRSRFAAWYQDLHPDEQATLRCLASLPHMSFAVGDVAACLLMDAVRAEAAVERLIEAHLVQARAEEVEAHSGGYGATYSLSVLVRAFARGLMY